MTARGASASAGDAFSRAHQKLLADRTIQFALPHKPAPLVPEWLKWIGRAIVAAWPVLRVLVWIGLGVALLALLWAIGSRFHGLRWPWRHGDGGAAEPETARRPAATPARALLAEADALAAQGRYGEAAHLLLQRSVADIADRHPALVRPATTSRDLSRAVDLAATRPAFAMIAEVVERSLFAARGADAEAWNRARAAYADLALPERWR